MHVYIGPVDKNDMSMRTCVHAYMHANRDFHYTNARARAHTHTHTQVLDIEAANAAHGATAPWQRTAGAGAGTVLMPPPAVPPPAVASPRAAPPPLTQAQVCNALP